MNLVPPARPHRETVVGWKKEAHARRAPEVTAGGVRIPFPTAVQKEQRQAALDAATRRVRLLAQSLCCHLFLCEQRKLVISSLFFLERLSQKLDGSRFPELFGQGNQRAVRRNFVVLHFLR